MNRAFLLLLVMAVFMSGCRKDAIIPTEIRILSSDIEFSAKGGSGKTSFQVEGTWKGTVEAESSAPEWLTVLEVSGNEVTYLLAPNQGLEPRSATITLTAGEASKSVEILQDNLTFDLEGWSGRTLDVDPTGHRTINLTYDSSDGAPSAEISYAAGETSQWLEVTVAEGAVTIRPKANITGAERSASILFSSEWISYEIFLRQEYVTSFLSHETFGCDSGASVSGPISVADYAVEYFGNWEYEADADWFGIERNGDDFVISIPENTTGADRRGSITIRSSADGAVISVLPVCQTGFSFKELLSQHVLKFGDGKYWLLDFMEDNGGFAVKVYGSDGLFKTDGYSLSLSYVPSGDRAPKLVLDLPQKLATVDGRNLMLYATSPDGYYSLTEGLGYDLVYSGNDDRISFDFKTEAEAYEKGFYNGFDGLFFMRGTAKEDWIVPEGEQDCLRLAKWGYGNHDGFPAEL